MTRRTAAIWLVLGAATWLSGTLVHTAPMFALVVIPAGLIFGARTA